MQDQNAKPYNPYDFEEKEKKDPQFLVKMKNSPHAIIRGCYTLLHSAWMVAMAVGGFIAWIISMLFL